MSRNRSLWTIGAALLVIIIVILVLAPGAWAASKYKTLHKFTGGADGELPDADLLFDQAGNLYGSTLGGGSGPGCTYSNGCGAIFELTPNTQGGWTERVLYNFCSLTNCGDGFGPQRGLVFDAKGSLYGTTEAGGNSGCGGNGCGVVFQLTPNQDGSWTESALYSFCSVTNCGDGYDPQCRLVFDAKGSLYGTTDAGGNSGCRGNGCGVVFQLTPNADGSWKEEVSHTFTGGDGGTPSAGLIFDQAGKNLYGTAELGGNFSQCNGNGCGLVFQLTPNADGSWREKVLHHFTGGKDGGESIADLIFDQGGNLYGTATLGGHLSYSGGGACGMIFKLVPIPKGVWNELVLRDFADDPGVIPIAGLVFDPAGNVYGTTNGDQVATFGSVFEITP